jgi:hypothetical protein
MKIRKNLLQIFGSNKIVFFIFRELFELQINEKAFACGSFQNMQLAKRPLAEEALEKLKETCFFISKVNMHIICNE